MRVAAVVVSWNSAVHLPALLASLERQTHPVEVVVVDNASQDASRSVVSAAIAAHQRAPIRLVTNATNRGFCGGVNDALELVEPTVDAVLFVNPDVVLADDAVANLVAALARDTAIGSVQPRLRRPVADAADRPLLDTTGHVLTTARIVLNRGEGLVDVDADPPGEVFGASGACALHRRAMLEDVRWADGQVLTEDLIAYFDDVELDWRARLLGWRAWYEPTACGVHERGGAGARRTPRVEALNSANRLLVLVTCDRPPWRRVPLIAVVLLTGWLELLVTVPRAVPGMVGQLAGLPAARRRRRELFARARHDPREIAAAFERPFSSRRWVTTWWRRIRGRAPGVAAGSQRRSR